MQDKTTESVEVVAAIIVTAGLVMGNLALFAPLRTDNRTKPAEPRPQQAAAAAKSAPRATFVSAAVQP